MGESKGGTALAKTTAAVRRSFRRSRKSSSAKAAAAAKVPEAGLTPLKGADEDTSSESSKPGEGEEASPAPAPAAAAATPPAAKPTPDADAPAAQLQTATSWTTTAKEKPGHVVSLRKHFDSLVSANGEVPAGSTASYVTSASGADGRMVAATPQLESLHPLVRLLLRLTCTEMCFLDVPAKAVNVAYSQASPTS